MHEGDSGMERRPSSTRKSEELLSFGHQQTWDALAAIAERCGMSLSGLSQRAGLDPTSFNPSKRHGPGGRKRWPSMETLSRVLAVAGMDMRSFAEILEDQPLRNAKQPPSSRRQHKRFPSILEGRIRLAPQGPQVSCVIRDISASGARLWLHDPTELPKEFDLEILRPGQSLRVGLVWSRDKSHGVRFLKELHQISDEGLRNFLSILQTPDDWQHVEAAPEISSQCQETASRSLKKRLKVRLRRTG
jgi:hypothetical protein